MVDIGKRFLEEGVGEGDLTYDEAKKLARHDDDEVRRKLAARSDIKPEILYYLAEDPSAEVRRVLAENDSTPPHADLLLASDSDQEVRGGLAEKIAKLAPGLSADEQDKVHQMAFEALEILTRDQVARVRQILSEALKDVAHAPPEVIRRLARDAELVVAAPVLEFSPVLTDEDLLEIIESGTASGQLSAISRRDGVGESVSDAIVETWDEEAVAFLLKNESAQLREETLDRIIDQAAAVESWHGPLVNRPKLSSSAATRLAQFVADSLIQTLTERKDLEPEVLEEVRAVVAKRLAKEGDEEERPSQPDSRTPAEVAYETALAQHGEGALDQAQIQTALDGGNKDLVTAALAVRCEVPMAAMQKVIAKRDAKIIIAVCWKAGLDAAFAADVQGRLAEVEDEKVMQPTDDGGYALGDDDLEWQLEFVDGLV